MIRFEITLMHDHSERRLIIERETMNEALRAIRAAVIDGEWQAIIRREAGHEITTKNILAASALDGPRLAHAHGAAVDKEGR